MSAIEAVVLGRMAEIVMGTSPPGSSYNHEGIGDPLLNGPTDFGPRYPSPGLYTTDAKRYAEPGDLLFCVRGSTTGRMNWADQRYAIGRGIAAIRGLSVNETMFLKAAIELALPAVLAGATGSTMPNLNADALRRVPVPRNPERERVGSILGAIDDLIENNRRRVEVLEEVARAIYSEWFVRFRYPGHENVPLVDSSVGPIPDGWKPTVVSEVTEVLTRGIAPKYAEDGAWTVINQRCIRNERLSLDKARRQERPVPLAKQVRHGDVLINSTGVGTLGRVTLCLLEHPSLTVDSHVTIARPSVPHANPWFGLELAGRQSELEKLSTGSTGQTELSRADIGTLPVVLPPELLLGAFGDAVWPLLSGASAMLDHNHLLASLRDLLLPKLVTGKIDVSHLDLEVLAEGAIG